MPDRRAVAGSNPFTHLRAVIVVAGIYLIGLVVWLTIGQARAGGRWFGVHLFTLGVLTNLILALSDHFSRTLTNQSGRPSWWRLPLVNVGVAMLLWGIPRRLTWAVTLGAMIVVAVVVYSLAILRRLRERALAGRFTWIVRSYERAHSLFVLGAILGALVGTGALGGSWVGSARLAHLHVNVLGWAGLTLLATVVFFGPTIARTRIEPGADARAARALPPAAAALTVAAAALMLTGAGARWAPPLRLVAGAALLVYAWAVVEIGVPLMRAAARARPSSGRGSLLAVAAWFALVVALDAGVVASGAWAYLDALGLAMFSGVLFQAVAASVAYLAPLLLRGDAFARARLVERIDRRATLRTIAWNAGVAATVLAAAVGTGTPASIAARSGWCVVLAATLWLATACLLPGPKPGGRRAVT